MENAELGSVAAEVLDKPETVTSSVEQNAHNTEQMMSAFNNEQLLGFSEKFGIILTVVAGQALLIRFVWFLFSKLNAKIRAGAGNRIKPLVIKNFKILTVKQIIDVIIFFLRIVKYLIIILQLFISLPLIFSLFPATRDLAPTIFGYVLNPLKNIFFGIVGYIPNLFTIAIILFITRYALRALKFFANQISYRSELHGSPRPLTLPPATSHRTNLPPASPRIVNHFPARSHQINMPPASSRYINLPPASPR